MASHKEVAGNEYNQSPYNVVVMRPDNRLRELRKKKGITQEVLAERTGVSQSAISQLENSEVEMGIKWMRAFARVLECSPADLLNDEDNPDRLAEEERDLVQTYREAAPPERATLARVAAAVVDYRGPRDREEAVGG
jgi:transcriptional regulator with XRE-family HTH domain